MACEWRIGFAESFVVTRGSSSLKRLLFVIDSLGPGGAERSLVDILPALMNSGVAPTIVCLQRASESFEAEARALLQKKKNQKSIRWIWKLKLI